MNRMLTAALGLLCAGIAFAGQEDSTKVASQNPSPMVEFARKHERIKQQSYPGITFEVQGLFRRPVQVFIPQKSKTARSVDLLIHFHGGSPHLVQHAATKVRANMIATSLSIGSGSRIYDDAFLDTMKLTTLVDSIVTRTQGMLKHAVRVRRLILSGFSAGYGAIRRIISTDENAARVDAILLLDGFHASYIPDRRVIAEGGRIDSSGLLPYLRYAEDAVKQSSLKRFLITHSEIFPGTFVSTTEATDWLVRSLGLKRTPVLEWGPLGMQQLSEVRKAHFEIMGFAGNSGPDHIDHLHGLDWFLDRLLRL